MNYDNQNKSKQLAREIMLLSRDTLLVKLRFMDTALSRPKIMMTDKLLFATNGRDIYCSPDYILNIYMSEREAPVRDLLHCILHCIFRHMYLYKPINELIWNTACDIAVEHTIYGLGLHEAESNRASEQISIFEELERKVRILTAERLYRYFVDAALPDCEYMRLSKIFAADDHRLWYGASQDDPQNGSQSSNDAGSPEFITVPIPVSETGSETEKDWKKISERIQMDMETFGKKRGTGTMGLQQNLREVNREKYNYESFLKKFAVRGEVMRINDEGFDYIFYTYGLKLYKKMPLIEPLEYKEVKRIKEFAIVIDTSGSVMGETVELFLKKTYNILGSTESFFSKVNIHIIQCDATVQEDAKITNKKEFDKYLENMQIRGLGGTDFRPAFEYIDQLTEKREFQNLKGLIYFTDGYGVFPKQKPEYDTAFVFLDEENNNYDVPPWAIKLILKKDEIS